jgi:hypothetical protein
MKIGVCVLNEPSLGACSEGFDMLGIQSSSIGITWYNLKVMSY